MHCHRRSSDEDRDVQIERAARTIATADHLLIAAGAGMGVDSGLPDYRGPEGFWNAHPPLREQRLRWIDLAQPEAFRTMPELAGASTARASTCTDVRRLTMVFESFSAGLLQSRVSLSTRPT